MRNRAGLRQIDVAHLLSVQHARISHIETGQAVLTAPEVVKLSVVYGKPIEVLLAGLIDEALDSLVEQLRTIPSLSRDLPELVNRAPTLQQLARKLEGLSSSKHAGA